ncbi:hypothetical protein BV22DRAFT_1130994 [Leucogyrophana mollusca]|uniref:Uncharacterized protein n=1 Tax=Leucogyrophana mollusca TaxID=85980 RepID=A0ACB8BDW3_9AGAM|nr:hypothetical protein BV22DRAFT_1130994 [Leucogyrophana mollusca]
MSAVAGASLESRISPRVSGKRARRKSSEKWRSSPSSSPRAVNRRSSKSKNSPFRHQRAPANEELLINRLSPPELFFRISDAADDISFDLYADMPDTLARSETPELLGEVMESGAGDHDITMEEVTNDGVTNVVVPGVPSSRTTVDTQGISHGSPLQGSESGNASSSSSEAAVDSILNAVLDTLVEDAPMAPEPVDTSSSALSPAPSALVLETCRQHLVPVVMMAAKAKDSGRNLDVEQCAAMITDEHCRSLLEKAKEMKGQLDALGQRGLPSTQEVGLKREREDAPQTWDPNARARSHSGIPRKDSEATLVDVPVRKTTPKAPRAMLANIHSPALAPAPSIASPSGKNSGERGWESSSSLGLIFTSGNIPPSTSASAVSLAQTQDPCVRVVPGPREGVSVGPVNTALGSSEVHSRETQPLTRETSPASHMVSSSDHPQSTRFPRSAPGLWLVNAGLSEPDILDVEFDVSPDLFIQTTEGSSKLQATLQLLCLPADRADDVLKGLRSETPEDIHGVQSSWPGAKLVLLLNPGGKTEITWLPYDIASVLLDIICRQY